MLTIVITLHVLYIFITMMSQKTPKDHYVPQFYLDPFAIEGQGMKESHIFQYMKDKVVSPRIKDVASEKHFYTFKDKTTGQDTREIDNFFTQIETDASIPLKKIISEEKINLCDEDLEKISMFFAVLAVRTPAFIKGQESMEEEGIKEFQALDAMNKERFRKRYEEAGIFLSVKELEKQRQFILSKEYSVEFNNSRGHFIAQGLKVAIDLMEIYYQRKHWHLLVSTTGRVFVTSDNPVSIYRPVFVPPSHSAGYGNGTILITISPTLAILLRDVPHKSLKINLTGMQVKEINKNIMKFSDNYIFSNINAKSISETYKEVGSKHFQKVNVTHHKWAPYIFMGPAPVPEEPMF